MIITVDPADREPPYQQIRVQVLAAIAAGTVAEGLRLPTIRQLAADLDLAANTVARAYRELEADGAIETRGRRGTFVLGAPVSSPAEQAERQLDAIARDCVAESRRLGIPAADLARALARALAAPGDGGLPAR